MTVRELIEFLQTEDPRRLVIIAKDAEGNGHSPLSSYWTGAYAADSTWSGEVGLEELTKEDKEAGYSEEDIIKGVPALILAPTN